MRMLARVVLAAFIAAAPVPLLAQNSTHAPASIPAEGQQQIVVSPAPTIAAEIKTGDIGGQALEWVVATFGSTIGAALTALIVKYLKQAGVKNAELLRDKLDDIIVNGLNLGAHELADKMAGKGVIEVKNEIAARAVQYAQTHGAQTLKNLGVDPTSPEAVEAIKARIETAINDPEQPTPTVLDPKASQPAVPPVA